MECGDDGCGGSCGSCGETMLCNDSGQCVLASGPAVPCPPGFVLTYGQCVEENRADMTEPGCSHKPLGHSSNPMWLFGMALFLLFLPAARRMD